MTSRKTHGPIVGHVTETSAMIWYRDDRVEDPPPILSYWDSNMNETEGATSIVIRIDVTADYTSLTKLENLLPDTMYFYKVGQEQGSFRTPGSAACSFVFGSCIGGQGYGRNYIGHEDGEGFPIFEKLSDLHPDFFLLNGDSIYADESIEAISSNPWNKGQKYHTMGDVDRMPVCKDLQCFRNRYKYHLEDPKLAKLLRDCPTYANWDDHEVIDNFGQETLRQKGLGKLYDDGRQAFFEFWPILPLNEQPQGTPASQRTMYRSFRWGPHVEVFIVDSRSYRDVHERRGDDLTPTMRYILGETQLQWLLDGLTNSNSTWKFIACTIPISYPTGWPSPEKDGYDGWSDGKWDHVGGAEVELMRIFHHIHQNGIDNVVFISGDVHFPFCISYDPFESGKPLFYEIGATPLQALCLPPPDNGPDNTFNPTVIFEAGKFGSKNFNFGHIQIEDDGTCKLCIRDRHGASMFDIVLKPTRMKSTERARAVVRTASCWSKFREILGV